MSCTHYRTMDSRRDELHLDFKYPHSCYTTTTYASTIRNPCSEVCNSAKNYSENWSNWKPSDLSRKNYKTYKEDKGDPPFADSNACTKYHVRNTKYQEAAPTISIEKMQICLKLLEDSNAALHLRNRDLIAENRSLTKRLEKDVIKIEKLQENVSVLQNELSDERMKMTDVLAKQTKNDNICLEDKCTSSTDVVSKIDRELQVWETCKDCHKKLEGCQRESLMITITKSEFELLEKDMQTLRDAVIVREEAWDKAMEREQNFRQQLARLTAETITTRHLCETCQDELFTITKALTEKESELKAMRKETLYLNKLIAKLYRHQKGFEENAGDGVNCSINEKDQKYIEDIAQRVRSFKGKSRIKFKSTSDKYPHLNSGSSRENKNKTDQTGSLEDRQN